MTEQEQKDAIIERVFGETLDWEKPTRINSPSPFYDDAFVTHASNIKFVLGAANTALSALSSPELSQVYAYLFRGGFDFQVSSKADAARCEVFDLRKELSQPPEWYAGGFGVAGHEADFEYWAKMEGWGLTQATCLSIGVEPEDFSESPYAERMDPRALKFFERRQELVRLKFFRKQFSLQVLEPVAPLDFCRWAIEKKIEIPDEMISEVLALLNAKTDSPEPTSHSLPEKSLEGRERDSLLKLIIILAVDGYGYDPKAVKSPIPNQIRSAMQLNGLDMDPATIRKWLREAAAILPEAAKDE
ncbi:hypothetical protein [Ahrensia sp. R2A130]|uniref:hypothetical protein n=1 Tax=Ahrensia sp. R2A130 TaxID=744979 RepID=UPI0001E0F107|nr:hypothetical protein [Ahrensia sp. R2A130]EFL88044.1 hypothetical protein R2A130_1862 [Ahrensia sp. R2A130]